IYVISFLLPTTPTILAPLSLHDALPISLDDDLVAELEQRCDVRRGQRDTRLPRGSFPHDSDQHSQLLRRTRTGAGRGGILAEFYQRLAVWLSAVHALGHTQPSTPPAAAPVPPAPRRSPQRTAGRP